MSSLRLRLRVEGLSPDVISLAPETPVSELAAMACAKARSKHVKLVAGYPPKEVPQKEGPWTLAMAGIRSGDTIVAKGTSPAVAPTGVPEEKTPSQVPAAPLPKLQRRAIPDDNSCLFNTVGVLLLRMDNAVPHLRALVTETVAADGRSSGIGKYGEGILGMPREEYIRRIQDPNGWGGSIELAILADHFTCELACMDVETLNVHVFGESMGFDKRAYLVYSGIHYDAVVQGEPSSRGGFNEGDVTVFSPTDASILAGVKQLGNSLHKGGHFTNVRTFALKCSICGVGLQGAKEAQEHAGATGHVEFGEYAPPTT